jgi:hypothetical protein
MPSLSESPFPQGQLRTLWEAITLQLTSDPILSGGVQEWQLWTGDTEDVMPVPFIALPALRLTPSGGQFRWSDELSFEGTMILTFDLAVPGTRASDLMDFWECIKNPLAAPDFLTNVLIPLRCWNVTSTAPTIKPGLWGGQQGIESSGVMTLSLNINSSDR